MTVDIDNLLQTIETTLSAVLVAINQGEIEKAKHRCEQSIDGIRIITKLRTLKQREIRPWKRHL